MGWAGRRRAGIAGGIALFFAALTLLSWYLFFYAPPTCFDGIQNQDEQGIDCDGSCALMCIAPRVDADWTRSVRTAPGVYHGVSLIKNPLTNVRGTGLKYTMSLYDAGNILVAERRGAFDLDPGATRVLFESNVTTGERVPVRALLRVDGGVWEKADSTVDYIRIIPGVVDEKALTFTASIENVTAEPQNDIVADALLYDAEGILVTASETRIPILGPRERQEVVFTWPEQFARPIRTSDIVVRFDERP
jgi:hypothetical protein